MAFGKFTLAVGQASINLMIFIGKWQIPKGQAKTYWQMAPKTANLPNKFPAKVFNHSYLMQTSNPHMRPQAQGMEVPHPTSVP